ncbi:unnamed protein product [marine sediment metagenome]|uniref:Uncharacterized protein n=1 Tax=marine sediment metagenome TaxID=412755 RepID=X1DS68_9ZZZZ
MTIEERLEQVENTLARVKRRNRWLVLVILLAAGVWVVFVGLTGDIEAQMGGEDGKTIRADSFVLVDETGKTRARLAVSKNGPSLSLYDEKGMPRVGLSMFKDGPMLNLFDEKGIMPLAGLGVSKDGPKLFLCDEKGETRARVAVFKSGPGLSLRPGMVLLDERGKLIWSAP